MKKLIVPSKKEPFVEKFHFFLLWFIRATLLFSAGRSFLLGNWYVFGMSLFALMLTFIVVLVEQRYKIDIPAEFKIGVAFLIYGSIFLGEVVKYYSTFWWWDLALHTLTGVLVGLIGFLILLVLYRRRNVVAAPGSIALFCFALAAAVGGVWEIFELLRLSKVQKRKGHHYWRKMPAKLRRRIN